MIDRKGNYRMLQNPAMKGFDSEFSRPEKRKEKENMHPGVLGVERVFRLLTSVNKIRKISYNINCAEIKFLGPLFAFKTLLPSKRLQK